MNESQENLLQELDSTLDILLKIDLTEHDMLFACEEDSTPMEFCMNPSSDIKISNILKKLSSLVDICGGNLKFNFLGGGSNSIKLVRKGEAIFCKNDDLFFSDYLIDCLSDRKLKDLNTYRVNKTNFDSNVNVMDILNKKKTWDEAKRKSTSDGEISDFDSDEETFVRKQSNAGSIRKNLYTKEEEMNILNFIIKKKVFSSVKSRQLWQVMERKKICGNRTWQSMKERFIKYIVPKIKTYHLNDTDESYILQGFKHSNCYQTRYKYHDIDSSNTDEEKDEHNLESKASESYNDRHGLKNCLIKFTDPILNKSADQIIPDSDTDINDTLIRNADNVIALHGLDCDNVKNSGMHENTSSSITEYTYNIRDVSINEYGSNFNVLTKYGTNGILKPNIRFNEENKTASVNFSSINISNEEEEESEIKNLSNEYSMNGTVELEKYAIKNVSMVETKALEVSQNCEAIDGQIYNDKKVRKSFQLSYLDDNSKGSLFEIGDRFPFMESNFSNAKTGSESNNKQMKLQSSFDQKTSSNESEIYYSEIENSNNDREVDMSLIEDTTNDENDIPSDVNLPLDYEQGLKIKNLKSYNTSDNLDMTGLFPEIEHEIINKNSPNHKDRPKLIEPADVSNLSEVITPDESDMSTEESDMSTVESDVVMKKSDRNETEDIYNLSSESTLSDSDEISLPTSKEKNQQKYTLTFHEKYGYKKKLMGQNWNGGEDECKFSIAEDISIIQYISKHKEIENIFGRKMWVLMQQQFSMKDRTWQSLKDRFNKRILPNISIYETEGLSKKIIDSFKNHYEAKSGKDSINKASQSVCIKEKNRFYTRKEKESIVKFIVENRRFNQIKGNQLFKTMARKMPNPKKRSWQSLKNTFKRYIMPNIDDYVTSKEILLKFKNAWMKKRKKKINFRKQPPVHTSSETEDENTSTETEDGNTSTEEEEATSLLTRSVESIKKSKQQKFSSDKDSTSERSSMETEGSDATVEFQKSSIKSRDGIRRKLFNKSVELFEETPIITTRLTKDKKSCKNNNERTIVIGSQSTKKKLNNKSNCCQSNSLSPSTNSTTKFTTVVEMEMSSPTKIIRSENLTSLLTRSKTKLSMVTDTGVSSPTKTTILGTTPAPSPMTVLADTVPFSQTKITRSKVFITSPQVITHGLDPSDQSITQHPEKKDKLQINVDSPIAALNSPYTKLNSPNTKFNSPNTKLNSPNTKLNSPNTKLNSPNTKLSSPNTKLNSPNTKLNSPRPNTKVISPNTKLNSPNTKLNSPNTKLNSPNTNLNSPNIELNSSNTKLDLSITKSSGSTTKHFTRRNRPTEKFDKLCGSDSSSDSSCELPDCSKAGNNKKISLRSNLRILKRKSSK